MAGIFLTEVGELLAVEGRRVLLLLLLLLLLSELEFRGEGRRFGDRVFVVGGGEEDGDEEEEDDEDEYGGGDTILKVASGRLSS
jgi:hypothetical protein